MTTAQTFAERFPTLPMSRSVDENGALMPPETTAALTAQKQVRDLRDGEWFSIGGTADWHLFAVHGFGTVSCYASGRKSSNGMTYRVAVTDDDAVTVLVKQDAS